MAYDITLFLIFVATVFVIFVEFLVIHQIRAVRTRRELKKEDSLAVFKEAVSEPCSRFLGYLAEHPQSKPVPAGCFGCRRALECVTPIKAKVKMK
jgi:hypothetical protein